METREIISETLLSKSATEAKDGNFNGKQLKQDFGGRKETLSREVLVLTSPFQPDGAVGARHHADRCDDCRGDCTEALCCQ